MFDEGELRHDLETSRHIINNLLSTMLPGADRTSGELVVQAHYNIYKRLAAVSQTHCLKPSGTGTCEANEVHQGSAPSEILPFQVWL